MACVPEKQGSILSMECQKAIAEVRSELLREQGVLAAQLRNDLQQMATKIQQELQTEILDSQQKLLQLIQASRATSQAFMDEVRTGRRLKQEDLASTSSTAATSDLAQFTEAEKAAAVYEKAVSVFHEAVSGGLERTLAALAEKVDRLEEGVRTSGLAQSENNGSLVSMLQGVLARRSQDSAVGPPPTATRRTASQQIMKRHPSSERHPFVPANSVSLPLSFNNDPRSMPVRVLKPASASLPMTSPTSPPSCGDPWMSATNSPLSMTPLTPLLGSRTTSSMTGTPPPVPQESPSSMSSSFSPLPHSPLSSTSLSREVPFAARPMQTLTSCRSADPKMIVLSNQPGKTLDFSSPRGAA